MEYIFRDSFDVTLKKYFLTDIWKKLSEFELCADNLSKHTLMTALKEFIISVWKTYFLLVFMVVQYHGDYSFIV